MTGGADVLRAITRVLREPDPRAKAEAARAAAELATGLEALPADNWPAPPDRPARPEKPLLVPPGKVRRRRLHTPHGRAALLHALAHIEFNAIDLAFDMALRFGPDIAREGLNAARFVRDWAQVGGEEAHHFLMLAERLGALGEAYGNLPAHDGLWKAAADTADDALARLAVAPLALEARGLDVTPGLARRLAVAGDEDSAAALMTIYRDEVGHVRIGREWFETLCARRGLDPRRAFQDFVASRLAGGLKPPFNDDARAAAGLDRAYYEPAGRTWNETCRTTGLEAAACGKERLLHHITVAKSS